MPGEARRHARRHARQRHAVRTPVVHPRRRAGRDAPRDPRAARLLPGVRRPGDGERAVFGRNLIVFKSRVRARRDREGRLRLARRRPLGEVPVGERFALRQGGQPLPAVRQGHVNVVRRQRERHAVVGLRPTARPHRHRPLRDRHLRRVNEVLVVRVRHPVPHHVFARVGVDRRRPPRQGGRPAPADPRASIIRRVFHRALPNHRRTKGRDEFIRFYCMPLAVVDRRRIELREPDVRHVALARLAAATFTATDAGLRYRERAVHGGDVVVARRCLPIQGIGEGVLACAHGGLLARERIRRPLTIHKTVAANRHLVCRERRAVIDLRIALRSQRHRAFRDLNANRADLRRVVRSRDPIPHLRVADVRVDRRRIDPVLGLVRAVLHHRRREEAVRRHGDAMHHAVVDVRVAKCRNCSARSNRNRRGDDRNLARDDRDRVVREVRPLLRSVVECVDDFALVHARHRRPVGGDDSLARHEVVTAFYKMWERMWLAVVHEVGLRTRGQRDRAFRDRHLRRMYEIFVVRVRHPVPHHVFARIGVSRRRPPRQGGCPAPADPRAPVIRRVLHRVLPNHRRAERRHQRVRVNRMALAVVHRGHVELREPAVWHTAVTRLVATAFSAVDVGLRHRQRAVHRGDRIVARRCLPIQGIGEGVLACAHGGLLARERIRRPLTIHKTVAANRHLVCRERRPVVDFRGALRGECNLARRDGHGRRIGLRDVAGRGDFTPHHQRADVLDRWRLLREHRAWIGRVLLRDTRDPLRHCHADSVWPAVIHARVALHRHVRRAEGHVSARHGERGCLDLARHAVRVGRVRERVRAVARHAPRAFAFARQPFCKRLALLRKRNSRPIAAVPEARICQRFIAHRWADAVVTDRETERFCHRRHRRGVDCAAQQHPQTTKRERRRP